MNQRGQTLIIGIVVGLLTAGALFVVYYFGTLKNQPQNQTQSPVASSNNVPLPEADSASPSAQNSTQTLPVQNIDIGYRYDDSQCKTVTDNAASEQFAGIPAQLINDLSAYRLEDCHGDILHTLIGLKGWIIQGNQGADGSMTASLYPSSNYKPSDPHITLGDYGNCSGCTLDGASPFFPAAKVEYDKNFPPSSETVTILKMRQLTPKLVSYSLPDTANGLEVNGIAYFDIDQPHFIKIETTLPKSEHDLATAILNSFIQREGLNK